jgi:hypothetical protein
VWPSPAINPLMEQVTLIGAEAVLRWLTGHLRRKHDTWLICPDPNSVIEHLHFREMVLCGRAKCFVYAQTSHACVVLLSLERGNLWLCSSGQFHGLPLTKIGEDLTPYTLQSTVDLIARESEWDRMTMLLDRHLRAMAEILVGVEIWASECWAPTASGIAWNAWLRHYANCPITLHSDRKVQSMERHATFGGRVECRYLGPYDQPIWRYDVQSHYPAQGIDALIPVELECVDKLNTTELHNRFLCGDTALALVEIEDRDLQYPIRWHGAPVWATGHYRTWLAGEELRRALDYESVTRVIWAATYRAERALTRISKEFIIQRATAKDDGRKAWESFIKLAYTGMYGRLARRETIWVPAKGIAPRKVLGSWTNLDAIHKRRTNYRCLGSHVELDAGRHPHDQSWQAGAGVFLASCRTVIDDLCSRAGWHNVLYIGVDGLHVTRDGAARLLKQQCVKPNCPGFLDLDAFGESGEYWGIFDYRIGERRVKAGVPKGHSIAARNACAVESLPAALSAESRSPGQSTDNQSPIVLPYAKPMQSRHVETGFQKPLLIPYPDCER